MCMLGTAVTGCYSKSESQFVCTRVSAQGCARDKLVTPVVWLASAEVWFKLLPIGS